MKTSGVPWKFTKAPQSEPETAGTRREAKQVLVVKEGLQWGPAVEGQVGQGLSFVQTTGFGPRLNRGQSGLVP